MNGFQKEILKNFCTLAPTFNRGDAELFLPVAPPDVWGVTVIPLGDGQFRHRWESAFLAGDWGVGDATTVIVRYINIALDFARYRAAENDVDYIQPELQ